MDRYYQDYSFQRVARARIREMVVANLGIDIVGEPVIDTGVILNASIFGGAPIYHSNSTPVLSPVVNDPSEVSSLAQGLDAISDEGLLHEGDLHRAYWIEAESLWRSEGKTVAGPGAVDIKGVATVCGQICGVTNFLLWLMTNPEEMKDLVSLVGRTLRRYVSASRQYERGGEHQDLFIASDLSGLMSPALFREFCASEEKSLYEEFAPQGLRFYHSDSNMGRHVSLLEEIGVNAVNIGPMVSVGSILSSSPGMRVFGQVPPVKVLWLGHPDLVVDSVRCDIEEALQHGSGVSRLTVCSAGSVNPGTPLSNIRAMMWAAMYFGRLDGNTEPSLQAVPVEFNREEMVDQIS